MNSMFNIEQFLDLSTYVTDERGKRRKQGKGTTAEFFTPYTIIKHMCDKISDQDWANPEKTWIETGFGNGQFCCYIVWNRIMHGINWKTALETLYGVELIRDNVNETHMRIINLLKEMGVEFDISEAYKIMRKNLVCSDFFKWDFENWKRIPEKPKQLTLF